MRTSAAMPTNEEAKTSPTVVPLPIAEASIAIPAATGEASSKRSDANHFGIGPHFFGMAGMSFAISLGVR